MGFVGSHLWEIRESGWGSKKILYPGVFTLIENGEGKFLAGKRTDLDWWGTVSGHMELNESLEDAVYREVKEECGLKIIKLTPYGVLSDPVLSSTKYNNGHECHHVAFLFHVKTLTDVPIVGDDEHSEWKYFTLDEMIKITGKSTKRNIELFLEFQKTGQFQLS